MEFHKSVLLNEAIEFLKVEPGEKYIDATLGGGGDTIRILEQGGSVLGLDADQEAITYVQEKIKDLRLKFKEELIVVKGNFRDIEELALKNGFEEVAGILFDLGVSSHQVNTAERGFSFQKDGELDMRMDKDLGVKAKDLIAVLSKGELQELFIRLGEERFASSIAKHIDAYRKEKPIETTAELAEIVKQSYSGPFSKIHPATKVFQALRIAVNDELHNLEETLPQAISLLKPKGRLVIISFHSLEDRIVKDAYKTFQGKGLGSIITKKPIEPREEEITQNARSRSAKMRVFERG